MGSDADDSEGGSDEASVGSEDSDVSLAGEEGEELFSSSDEAGGVVLEGGMGFGQDALDEPTEEEMRRLDSRRDVLRVDAVRPERARSGAFRGRPASLVTCWSYPAGCPCSELSRWAATARPPGARG